MTRKTAKASEGEAMTGSGEAASPMPEPEAAPAPEPVVDPNHVEGMTRALWSNLWRWRCKHCTYETFEIGAARFHAAVAHQPPAPDAPEIDDPYRTF
jgi:hypothetical protein